MWFPVSHWTERFAVCWWSSYWDRKLLWTLRLFRWCFRCRSKSHSRCSLCRSVSAARTCRELYQWRWQLSRRSKFSKNDFCPLAECKEFLLCCCPSEFLLWYRSRKRRRTAWREHRRRNPISYRCDCRSQGRKEANRLSSLNWSEFLSALRKWGACSFRSCWILTRWDSSLTAQKQFLISMELFRKRICNIKSTCCRVEN